MTTNEEIKEEVKKLRKFVFEKCKFHFDEIQKILDEKEKGKIDINLDILYKIHNNGHNECVKILRKIESLDENIK